MASGGSSTGGAIGSGGMAAIGSGGGMATGGGGSGGMAMAGASGSGGMAMAGASGSGGLGTGATGGAIGAGGAAGGSSPTGTETTLANLPTIRQEHGVAAAAGEIFVIGGYIPSGTSGALQPTSSVIAYDPAKNSWRDVKDFPVPMDHGNVAVIDDTIYVAGFFTRDAMTAGSTRVFAYDPKTDAWTEKQALRAGTERGAGCVAVDAGLMYVFGGINDTVTLDYADRYDPATDSWQQLPPLPERKDHCAAAAIAGIITVVGGRADGITNFQPNTWTFNPQAMSWTQKTAIATPRGGLAGGVLDGKLYVFGGEGNAAADTGVFPNIDVYDPAADSWKRLGSMLVPRHGFGGAVLSGKIYLPGGAIHQGGWASDTNSVFSLP